MSVYISFFRVVPRSCISATWIIYSLIYRRERAGDMFLLNLSRKMYVCMLMSQSCLTLYDPMDCSPPCFSVHWIFQVRILEWVAISSSGGSSQPKNAPTSSALAGRFLPLSHLGSPWENVYTLWNRNYWDIFYRKDKPTTLILLQWINLQQPRMWMWPAFFNFGADTLEIRSSVWKWTTMYQ